MTANGANASAIAFLSCIALIPAVNAFCARFALFDSPGPLKIHSQPIPSLGGVAIALSSLSIALLVSSRLYLVMVLPFFAALALIWLAGLIDDIRGLSPVIRLAAQIVAASMLWYGGWRLPLLGNGAIGLIGICLFVVAFVNSFNFWDGADGLAAGSAFIIAVAYIALSGNAQSRFSVVTAWALAGTCLAFIIVNFPPAKLFMGDSGSTAIGLVIAFLALNPSRTHGIAPTFALYLGILPAALPLLDAALAILRRLRHRGSPLWGDRRHFYDILLARGWSARRVALSCYGITAMFCFVGYLASLLAARNSTTEAVAISGITIAGFVFLEWRLGSLRVSEKEPQVQQAPALRLSDPFENSR